MNFTTTLGYVPTIRKTMKSPETLTAKQISVVIPVKDNQRGIDLFLKTLFESHPHDILPGEILIVDSPEPAITIAEEYLSRSTPVSVIHCNEKGPAAARNLGWKTAKGEWILFTDSDCIPEIDWIKGYSNSMNGSLAYAGNIKSYGDDWISRYYDSQQTLIPPPFTEAGIVCPEFIITANALVWKTALVEVGGFNEDIKIAAGEDVDLGFRLREIGKLSYAPGSLIRHNFDEGLGGFVERFKRYGMGNRKIAELYRLDLKPRRFKPRKSSIINHLLALLQLYCLSQGYRAPTN